MSSLFARAVAVGFVALGLPAVILADTAPTLSLSPAGYTMVSQVRADRDHFFYTYSGVLVNSGPALTGVTATLTSSVTSVQVVTGQSTLEFSPVPAGTIAIPSQVTSTNTFTILVDRTVPFSFSNLVWAFNNPFADPGAPQTVPVLSTVTLNGTGSTNPSGIGTLTYSWSFQTLPAGSNAQILNSGSATASFVPDVIGTYVLALTVSNGPQSNTETVTISTTDVPPTANAGPNQTEAVGALVTLDGTKSSDANGQPLSFLWAFVSIPNNSSAILSNPRSPKPSFVADKDGSYIVGLVVNDGTLSSSQSTVTISTGNTAPVAVATANSQSVNVNGLVQLDGSKSTDVNSNALTYSWSLNTSGAPGSKATLSDPTIVNPTFTADVPGTYIAQLIVNDGVSSSKPTTVTITTNTVLPPTANAGSSQQVTAGTTVQLQGSGTDPQGLILTFKWSLTTVPLGSTASLSAANIANPTFVADLPGTYVAQLVVNNGVLSSNPQTVTITSTSLPPVAVPSTTTPVVSLGQLVLLSGSQSTDPQGLPLTYSWSLSVPSGSNATLSSLRSPNPSFTPDVAGTYVAQLIVNDGFQSSQPQTVSISAGLMTIALAPSPLNLTNSPQPLTVTISPGAGNTAVTVGLSGFDATVIKLSSNPVTIPANSSSANVTVTPLAAGNTGIVASATGYASATDQVSVKTPTIAIAFNNGATGIGLTHTVGGTVALSGPAPQPDGTTVTLSVDSSSAGAVSFSPTTVLIPAGSTTGTFSITGTQLGNVNIDGNAAGYTQAQASILVVNLGGISISQNLTVGVGESQPLSVTLSTPAPVDGVTVNLKVSDSNTITVSPSSVTIAPGAKTPATAPQVTGVALGSATITASAGGYAGDTENVTVSSLVVFAPTSLTVGIGSQQSFNVQLSSPAPASGLVVTLSSNNGNVTVTPTVTFTSGQQSLPASVTGVSSGTSTITATTNNPQVSAVNASLAVTITNALVLPCPTTTSGEVNAPFTGQFSATGGSQPYTYSVVGTLPQGLTLSATGLVSGTPSASGSFSIQVKDANGVTSTSCSITISTALALPCPGTVSGEVGTAFNGGVAASGGAMPYTYTVVGTLPTGLSLNASTGAVTGTPTVTGTFSIKATDALGVSLSSCQFTIAGALSLPCPAATQGEVNNPFNAQLSAANGITPYTYTVVGTLPAGLSLDASTGIISGTPTASGTFKVQAKDATGATAASCTITIGVAISLPCPGTTSGEVGVALNIQLSAANGVAPYTYTVAGTLPSGLTLNPSTGLVSGTPTATGSFNIKVTDAAGATATSCSITIANQLSLPCPGSTGGDVGVVFNSQLAATGGVGPYTYSVVGTLPNGLSLNSSTGVISGTPSAMGSFTVKVTDSIGGIATSCAFTISPPLALPCPIASVGDVGAPFSAQLSPSGGTAPYTFTVVGALPGGLTLNATGLVSGTPTTAGSFSVKVTDAVGSTITVCQFTIDTALAVPCPAITSGEIGTAFSSQLMPTGGTAPYTYTLIGTALPNGITLNPSTGLISGTPTSVGVFEVQVKDAAGVVVNSCKFKITTAVSLPCPGTTSGEQGIAFSSQLSASGGAAPYTYTVVGTLPAGLSLNASTGLVNGTPTTAGTFSVQVKDANGFTATSCALTISGAFTLPCPATTSGEIGGAFSSQLSAAGGVSPYTYSVVGTLPGGLSLNVSTGLVSGTPTSAGSFTVQAKDSAGATATSCTITIATALALPCPATTTGEVGTPFSSQVTASGGVGPYTYSVNGVLPGGLTVNSSTGLISGTPTASGSFKIQVKDSLGFAVITACSLTINGTVSLPCPTSPTTGEVNVAFSSQLSASGGVGPYTYTVVGSLPQGLSLNAATGLVSGTPTTAGTFSVQAKDANGATATSCAFTIVSAVSLPSPATTTGEMGIAFNAQLAATGGVTPYTYAAVGLPSGLTLNSSTGAIGGTPTAAGSFSVKVTDALGATATSSAFTIAATLTLPCPGTTKGDQGVPFSAQLTAANGVAPYTFSVVAGSLPTGLTLNTSTGLVSGTPQGSATFSIKATDALGATATSCTFTIAGPLSLPCPGNVTGEVGAPFSGQFQALGGTPAYTYSVVGTLPNGLTLNTSTGAISGTPTGAGSFSVQVKDATGATVTSGCSVNIVTMVTLTCPGTNSGAIGSPFSATMTPAGGILPYTLSLQSGTLPTGLTLTGTTISGTPSAAGNFTFMLTDGAGVLAATTCSFKISTVALQFQTTSLPNGAPNVPYSATVTAIGGTTPYTFSLGSSAPSWLQINPVTGVITGNPSRGSGTFSVPVTVMDSSTPTQQTVSTTFMLTISQIPLAFVTTSLPDGTVGLSYSQQIVVTGGTTPYNWKITPVQPTQLPAWFTFDPTGVQCGSSGPTICGTPPAFGSVTFTLNVTDSSPTAQNVTKTFTLTIDPVTGPATLSLAGGTGNSNTFSVGQNLEVPITLTFNPAPTGSVQVTLSSNSGGLLTFTGTPQPQGATPPAPTSTFTISISQEPSVTFYVQGVGSSGTFTITAQVPNYQNGTATVTLGNSGFVLSSPAGLGGTLNTFEGITTPLTVGPALLDSNGLFKEYEIVAYQKSFNVPFAVAPSTLGSVSPASITFTSGMGSVDGTSGGPNFTASTTSGGATISIQSQPTGFVNPTVGASFNANIQPGGFVAPSITVGNNLQVQAFFTLTSPPASDITVTLQSNDSTRLQFSATETGAGSGTLPLTVPAGQTNGPNFWVRAYDPSKTNGPGSITYSISGGGLGMVTGTVTIGATGLIIQSPAGLGAASFSMTPTTPSATLAVFTAVLNSGGTVLATQEVAFDQSLTVNVQSGNTATGTISSSPITIGGATASATTTFVPSQTGSSTITASSSSGFQPSGTPVQSASVNVTVTSCSINASDGQSVGQFLEAQGSFFLSCAAGVGGLQVTLTSNSPFMKLAVNPTDPGSNQIVITVPQNGFSGAYWIYGFGTGMASGEGASPASVTLTATATGYASGTGSVGLVPSAIYIEGPGGRLVSFSVSSTASPQTLTVQTTTLSSDGNNTPQFNAQAIAGNVALTIALSNSNSTAGTLSSNTATIAAGATSGTVTLTPKTANTSTTISVTQPAGWIGTVGTVSKLGDVTKITANVTP